jgi:4-hydroxy-tetrahydrodipicolinate synthase
MFTGCGTALVTPFRGDGKLDEPTLRSLVRRQIEQGIDFLVPCGTTGESPTLNREEHLRVVSITVEESAKRVPVIAGAGGNNTREVVELAWECERAGADGLLSVTPYYNKPSQEGLYQHYRAIAGAVSLPIVVYSVQGRTAVNIEPATVQRLAEIDNIVGVKEASGNITQIAEICCRMPESFAVLSGDDAMTIPVISLGGRGVISTSSNQIPGPFAELTRAALNGDYATARAILRRWMPLIQMNFIETNPITVKWAMGLMGLIEPVYRLPMVAPSEASKKKVEQVIEAVGLMASAGAH